MPTTRQLAALPLLALAALAACVQPPAAPPAVAPPPRPVPQPAPPPPAPTYSNWMDAPQTPGDWFYIPEQGASIAAFGPAQRQPLFALRCDTSNHAVSVGRTSASTVSQPMTIRTESVTRTFATTPAQGIVEHLVAISAAFEAAAQLQGEPAGIAIDAAVERAN